MEYHKKLLDRIKYLVSGTEQRFSLEKDAVSDIVTKSDHLVSVKSPMIFDQQERFSFFPVLEEKVIQAASEARVPIIMQGPRARKLAMEAKGEEDYEETPSMFFEDLLDALETADVMVNKQPGLELTFIKSAAVTAKESLENLRETCRPEALNLLKEVETTLWERVRELEREKGQSYTPG